MLGSAQQESVDDAEHDGIRADRQRERDNRHRREGGIATQATKRMANVLLERVDHGAATRVTSFLTPAGDSAELLQCESTRDVG